MRRTVAGLCLSLSMLSSVGAQTFDNNSVIALHRAGLGDAAVVAKVNSVPCTYDVSTDALIALKRAGLSDAIIAAMVERCDKSARAQGISVDGADPASAHAPGIYLMQAGAGTSRMLKLRPSKAGAIKVSGNGSVLFPYVGKLVLPDAHSRVEVKEKAPTFYFYFLANDRNVSDFGTPNSIAAQSPDEFSLVRFRPKPAEREVGVGKLSVYSARRGLDTKDAVHFETTQIGEFAYKVEVPQGLAPGEYGFVLTGANNSARVYDFSVVAG